MEQKVTTPLVKGVIITLLLIVFGLIIYFTGQIGNSTIGYLQYVILIAGIIWCCTSYAKQMNGNVTFGNVFGHGFKTTAVVAAFMVIYTVIAVKFLFPDMVDQSMEIAKQKMQESSSKLSDEQIEQSLSMVRKFFIPFAIGGIILGFALIGAIASLIGAAVAKKNPPTPFQQQTQI